MSVFRSAAIVTTASLAFACGASPASHRAAPVATPMTSPPPGDAPAIAKGAAKDATGAWVSVPFPARSITRLRTLLHNAPSALRMLDAALLRFQVFDLEQPAYLTSNGGSTVFSVGLGPELAATLRKNDNDKCVVVEVRGNPRFACGSEGKPPADLARAEPPHQTLSDLHFEANGAVMRELARKKVSDEKTLDALGTVDGISVDINLEGTPELRLAWRVTGEDPTSIGWLNAPVAPPPAAFSQLPGDSEMAIFGHAPSAADQAPMKKVLFDAVESKDSECAANSAAERAELEKLFFTGGPFVGAVGFDRARAEAAAEALNKAPTDKKKLAAARESTKAWAIFGVEEPAARWTDGLVALQKLDCVKKGKAKHRLTVNKKLAPRLGLPAGTVELTNVKPADKDGSGGSRDVVLIAPDRSAAAERTWIVVAHDEATAVARLKGLAAPSALASRPGLASLRDAASAGAFVTAGGLQWLFGDEKTDAQIVSSARGLLQARDLPTGGRTPIVLHMASTHDANGKGGETSVRVSLDAAALGDIAALMF